MFQPYKKLGLQPEDVLEYKNITYLGCELKLYI